MTDAKDVEPELRWQAHVALYKEADTLYRSGNWKAAIAKFRAALELAPRDSDTLWALGDCFSERGRPWHAERLFRKALANAPWKARGDLLYNVANALLDQGRPRAGLRLYRRVPRHASGYRLAQRNALLALRRISMSQYHSAPVRNAGQRVRGRRAFRL